MHDLPHASARRDVPEADRLVVAARDQRLAVRRKCDGPDQRLVSLERVEPTAGSWIPQLDRVRPAEASEHLAVWGKEQTAAPSLLAEAAHLSAGRKLADHDGFVCWI